MSISPQDRFEIQDLYAHYAHTVDANDGDGWANCFTKDGVFVPSIGPIRGRSYQGRNELAALGGDPKREVPTRHWNCHQLLTERDGYIEGKCYALAIDISGTQPELVASVVYYDEIVREDGTWKFRARRPQCDVERPEP